MIKTDKNKLKELVLDGISTEELNSKYDYSQVTDMSRMFSGCSELKTIPDLCTSQVTNMHYMFSGCSELKTIPDLCTSQVTDMSYMFNGCSELGDFDPYNYPLFDFTTLYNQYIKKQYPELLI